MQLPFHRKPKTPTDDTIIYRPPDRGTVALAWSLLDGAGVRCVVDIDYAQDLFGVGRLGYGYNFPTGPAKISVMREDAEVAREILSDLREFTPSRPPNVVRWLAIAMLVSDALGLVAGLLLQHI